jgi:hypothetical protein
VTVLEPLNYPPAGSYVVVHREGLGPWVVRRATHSWADHALICTDSQGGIVEALPGGVRAGHLSEYSYDRIAANSAEQATPAQLQQVADAASSMVGLSYDDLAIVDDGLASLGWHWRWLARRAEDEPGLVCSALVVKAGAAAGLDWSCGKATPEQVTPADLERRPSVRAWHLLDQGVT